MVVRAAVRVVISSVVVLAQQGALAEDGDVVEETVTDGEVTITPLTEPRAAPRRPKRAPITDPRGTLFGSPYHLLWPALLIKAELPVARRLSWQIIGGGGHFQGASVAQTGVESRVCWVRHCIRGVQLGLRLEHVSVFLASARAGAGFAEDDDQEPSDSEMAHWAGGVPVGHVLERARTRGQDLFAAGGVVAYRFRLWPRWVADVGFGAEAVRYHGDVSPHAGVPATSPDDATGFIVADVGRRYERRQR